ncbi:hypothetical protein ACA348_09565 [Orientia tsutsugamushi]|uniref:hypothetical protein n=1 Tax=Orientia tsutsugamushi TaxID=784 RepID=UPI003527C515
MSIRVLRFIIGFIVLVNVNNIYAVEYELEADELLKLEISDSGPTRINLKDEKINDIFMYPQNAAEENKLYLTAIGEYKTIQDLMLTFTSNSKPCNAC